MFAATIDSQDLQDAFDPVHALVDECKLQISEAGLSVTAVDPGNVGMVSLDLPHDVFDSYEAHNHTVGISLERFLDVVSLFTQNDDPAHLLLDEDSQKLRLESGGLESTLSLIDPDAIRKEPEIPDLNVTATITLTGEQFTKAVNACDMVADHMTLAATPDKFYASADGDTDTVEFEPEEDGVLEFDGGDAESLFSLEYLRDMERPIPSGTPVTVQIGMDFPVLITFNVVDEHASVEYVLAPRITDE